ncbi:uncharacterized protein V1516DRAFT_620171, partial [Lipomyces oligophaga]|uniref:uncharacterized protein n=1 Tax=Lipomyces oligophaga TaxID=45792 RepID=UPI0034CD235B
SSSTIADSRLTSSTSSSPTNIVAGTKRRKRHGPAVSSAWISQDPTGRGRPPNAQTSISSMPLQLQREGDDAELAVVQKLEEKFVNFGVPDHHAREVATQLVRNIRAGMRVGNSVSTSSTFSNIFGGLEGIDDIEFEVMQEPEPFDDGDEDGGSETTIYLIGWKTMIGGISARFDYRAIVGGSSKPQGSP